jgi:hypothetical protein
MQKEQLCKNLLKDKTSVLPKGAQRKGQYKIGTYLCIQVANQLGIKYSTAKTLLRNYRQIYEQTDKTLIRTLLNEHKNKEKSKVRCSYAAMPTKAYDIGCGNSPLTTSITESLIFRPRI